MINEDPNMGRKQIFDELPLPSKVEEKGILNLIYKGVFIVVKLLLDIRLNLVKISEGKTIQTKYKQSPNSFKKSVKTEKPVDNAVIKETDNVIVDAKTDDIKLQEGSVKKGGVNETSDTNKPDFTPTSTDSPVKPETESSEKSTEQGEKKDEETKS